MKRKFILGSEWIYLKIYTGVKTADIILEEAIEPLIEYLKKTYGVFKWFFIRYNDPKPHLRIRIKITTHNYNEVFDKINVAFQEYIDSGEVSNIVIDTYNREIERYGQETIVYAETLFYKNSEFALQCLYYDDEEKIIISLFYIDKILDSLNLSFQEKLNWIKNFNQAFKQELNNDKKLNSLLDKKIITYSVYFLKILVAM